MKHYSSAKSCEGADARRRNSEDDTIATMDEGRKRVLLIAASILAARKLAQFDGRAKSARDSKRDCGRRAMGRRDYEGDFRGGHGSSCLFCKPGKFDESKRKTECE